MGATKKNTGDQGKALTPEKLAAEFKKLQEVTAKLKAENTDLNAVAEENETLKAENEALKAAPDVIASTKKESKAVAEESKAVAEENASLKDENAALKAAAIGAAPEKVEPIPKLTAKEREFNVEIVEKLANGEKRVTKGKYRFKEGIDAVFFNAKKVLIADALENEALQEAYVLNSNVLIEKIN